MRSDVTRGDLVVVLFPWRVSAWLTFDPNEPQGFADPPGAAQQQQQRRKWPAALLGALSGLFIAAAVLITTRGR